MEWKENFKEGKELILATSSKSGKPNSNIVLSLGFKNNKLLVADCQMKTTIENLKENPLVCIISGYLRLKGKVKIFNSGEDFNYGKKVVYSQDSSLGVKNILVISVEEVFDLDNGKKLF
jgi:uncharacterized pyridoxamine 5'-phosphate oxidase family protein